MPGDTAWLASHVLKRIGVDVAAWNTEGEAAKHTMSYDIGFKAKLEGVVTDEQKAEAGSGTIPE